MREAAFRLHEDQPVHAVGDVMRHAWRRAVIDEHAGDKSLECHDLFLARPRLREVRSTTWTGGAVEVHRVIHEAVVVVLEMYLDRVADTHADEGPGYLPVERPEIVGDLIVQLSLQLDGLQVDSYDLGLTRTDGRR